MGNMALVQNGKIVDASAAANSESTKKTKASENTTSGLGKEAFLQLLVAQMQYQDPLQPTENTEYIAQLATFSQLEATQNLEDTVNHSMGNDLVGKYVILNTTTASGASTTVAGKVDYVMYENGNVYLSVNDKLYSMADLDTVADSDYYEAAEMSTAFTTMMAKLPNVNQMTKADVEAVENAKSVYDAMTDYQKSFLRETDVKKLEALVEKLDTYK